jgi:hypothetical protein
MLDKINKKLWSLVERLENKEKSVQIYDEALSHYKSQKYRNAFPLMKEAALLGEKNAMAMLGTMILFGQGTYENGEEALKWLHKAVDAGQTDTLGVLGMAYASGKGKVKRDKKLALEYLDKAAKLGDQKSIKMLDMIQKKEGMFRRDW